MYAWWREFRRCLCCELNHCGLSLYFVGKHQVCIESANQVAHVNCGNCRMLLMYQYGARSVKCAVCNFVTSVGANVISCPCLTRFSFNFLSLNLASVCFCISRTNTFSSMFWQISFTFWLVANHIKLLFCTLNK